MYIRGLVKYASVKKAILISSGPMKVCPVIGQLILSPSFWVRRYVIIALCVAIATLNCALAKLVRHRFLVPEFRRFEPYKRNQLNRSRSNGPSRYTGVHSFY